MKLLTISDTSTGRIRVRQVATTTMAEKAAAKALETGKPAMRCAHGGDVCNTYGYPAETECAVVVAIPMRGDVYVAAYKGQRAANKVTLSGAAAEAFGEAARPIWDDRYGEASTATAWRAVVATATADIHMYRDPAAQSRHHQRQTAKDAAAARIVPLWKRLENFKSRRRSAEAAKFNAAHQVAGYYVETNGNSFFLRHHRDYVASAANIVEAVAAMERHMPLVAVQEAARLAREVEAAKQQEAAYQAMLAAVTPSGNILFDAEGGFRAQPSDN